MSLHIFNSLSARKELFEPKDPREVKIYTCGPTVYNYNHIGNFRAYIFVDILRRYLRFRGYGLNHAMNITDVDDKIIENASRNNKSISDFTEPYARAFLEDLRALRIEDVEHRPRATDSIPAMKDLITELEKRGHVYSMNESVYFQLRSFSAYGNLSRIDPDSLRTAADGRFEADEYAKEDVRDFALWKAPANESEPAWDSPWGPGRPGWHLECSAMIRDIFGPDGVDIHTGGIDLLFPHHENEIAQSHCAHPGENFVRYWLHNEHLLVNGQKMSKSLGNFYTLRDLIEMERAETLVREEHAPPILTELIRKGRSERALRYLLLSFHYRTKLNFTFENLQASETACERMEGLIERLLEMIPESPDDLKKEASKLQAKSGHAPGRGGEDFFEDNSVLQRAMLQFIETMDDDLNMPRALAVIFDLVRELNRALENNSMNAEKAKSAILFFMMINGILDVLNFMPPETEKISKEKEDYIQIMIDKRNQARLNKDFAAADQIRDELKEQGITLIDTPQGIKWK